MRPFSVGAESIAELATEGWEQNRPLQLLTIAGAARADQNIDEWEQGKLCEKLAAIMKGLERPDRCGDENIDKMIEEAKKAPLDVTQLAALAQSPFQAKEVYAVALSVAARSPDGRTIGFVRSLLGALKKLDLITDQDANMMQDAYR